MQSAPQTASIPQPNARIERIAQVVARTSLSASTIYRLVAAGKFPKPTKLSADAAGWFADQIDAWLEERRNAPNTDLGREPKAPRGKRAAKSKLAE